MHGPRASAYRAELLGSKPERALVSLTNTSSELADVSSVRIAFKPDRNGIPMQCPSVDDLPLREPRTLRPKETVVFERELCSLPLPGHYTVGVMLGRDGLEDALVGSFAVDVTAKGPNIPRELPSHTGLYAAMGADLSGVRYTSAQWEEGTYHIVVRLTNAGILAVPSGDATVMFRVRRNRLPLACTSSHDIVVPRALAPGDNIAVRGPVTCLVDARGVYQIDASIALPPGDGEVWLGAFDVEVTSDPLLYLPTWPIAPW